MDNLKLFLYIAPIALGVLNNCKQLGLNPVLPVLGLIVGLMIELNR